MNTMPLGRTMLLIPTLFLAAAAAAQEPADSIVCAQPDDRPAAESVADDITRVAALAGERPSRPMLIRRGRMRPPVACSAPSALGPRWTRAPDDAPINVLPISVTGTLNSSYPRETNNGPVWSGRGLSGTASAGVDLRYGVLSARVAPIVSFSENRTFDVPASERSDVSRFAYPWHRATIDWPTRPGNDAVSAIDPGQSFVRLDAYGLAAGLSTENVWWGPALYNPLLFSNTAPGFAHLFLGTSRPLDVYIGALEFELLWGRLTESEYFDGPGDNDRRLIASVVVDFEPAFARGVYLGVARSYLTTIPPDGFGLDDYILRPYTGLETNVADPFAGENQIVSVFGRFVAPGAGLEAWAEWARDDRWRDLEDLVKQPDHSQAYTLGVQKVVVREGGWLRLYGELTHLQAAVTIRSLRPGAIFYTNTSVVQGYTHRGQLLGAGIGPGSDAQIVGGDWFTNRGRSGLFLQRIRYDDDAYYTNFARFYGEHGHDVELTAGVRQLLFIHDFDVQAELTYSHRYNRNFVGLDAADFDALFTESNWGLRIAASWHPRLSWSLPGRAATPARR